MATSRRDFLKLAGAGGVAIVAFKDASFEPRPDIVQDAEPVTHLVDDDTDIVIDLEKVYHYENRVDNNPRRYKAVGEFGDAHIGLGMISDELSIDIYADETVRDWLLEGLRNDKTIRVIDKRIKMNRRMLVSQASLNVRAMNADLLLHIDGILLAS